MNYHWNWSIFFQTVPSGDETYLAWIIHGLGWTVAISLSAWVIALVLGSLIGTLRTAPNRKLALLGHAWVEFFRNVVVRRGDGPMVPGEVIAMTMPTVPQG